MRLTTVAAIMGIMTLAAPAFAGPKEGGEIYETRCKMCHGSGVANAPLIDVLKTLDNDVILAALTTPVPMMTGVVSSLSDEDKRNIAVFLSGKSLPATGDLPAVTAE
ncbi:MAG: c-type cytochrome [Hyphomonadaceae bacterium]